MEAAFYIWVRIDLISHHFMKSQCGMCQDDVIMLGGQKEEGEAMPVQPQSGLSVLGVGELRGTSVSPLSPSSCSVSVAMAHITFKGIFEGSWMGQKIGRIITDLKRRVFLV